MSYRNNNRRTGHKRYSASIGAPTGVYEIDNPYNLKETLNRWTPDKPQPGKVPVVAPTGAQGTMQAGKDAVTVFNDIVAAMRRAGANDRIAHYAGFQAALETGGFTSNVMKQNGNYSGIKYAKQAGATQGTKSPEGNYFAKYATMDDWARDLMRLLSFRARAVDATSIDDYAARLKQSGYYGSSESSYAAGMKRYEKLYAGYKAAEAAVKNPIVKPAEKKESDSILEWVSDNPLKTLGLALGVMLIMRR